MRVIGIRRLNYKNKQGRQISGVQIFAVNKITHLYFQIRYSILEIR